MNDRCMECGADLLTDHPEGEGRVQECGLCGELQGDDDLIIAILKAEQARQRGIDPRIFGLVALLENVNTLRVDRVESGDEFRGTWPTIFFHLEGKALRWLTPILKSLTLSGQRTHYRWTVEVQYQHRLQFLLRPRLFWAGEEDGKIDLGRAFEDLETIESGLVRDQKLSWWRAS